MQDLILKNTQAMLAAIEGIRLAQQKVHEAQEVHGRAHRSFSSAITSLIKDLCAAHTKAHPETPMMPSLEGVGINIVNSTDLHVSFTRATKADGEIIPHGTTSTKDGIILVTIQDQLRDALKNEGVTFAKVFCTLPDAVWRQDELAKESII